MINTLRKSVGAGFLIGISGYISLMCDNKYISAILFSIGLYTICVYGLKLYTGMSGYICECLNRNYPTILGITLLGNVIGCSLIAIFPLPQDVFLELQLMISQKSIYTSAYESFLCGCLMFIAVDSYRKYRTPIGIFLAVPAFILSGMEHSIANTYYLLASRQWAFIPIVLICVVGNTLGSILTNELIAD